jgi:F-type H+-transporting ATPase subunit alpha
LVEMLKQKENSPLSFDKQAVMIYAGIKWYLDTIQLSDVAQYEQKIYDKLDTTYKSLSDKIVSERKLSDDIEDQIKILVQEVADEF